MTEVLPRFLEEAGRRPELAFVDSDLKMNRAEARLDVDRQRAADLGVPILDIARTLQVAFGDQRIGYFTREGRQYSVLAQLIREDRNELVDLKLVGVRSNRGDIVTLDDLVTYREVTSPSALYRFDRYMSATVSAGIAPGHTLGDGIQAMNEVAAATLPSTFSTALTGEARELAESSSSLIFAFVLALVLIFLVLAAQFESFVDPVIILLTVPMSLAGAVLALAATGSSLNVFSQIGIVMLIGLVTKNGILIVEFANQKKRSGRPLREAAIEAAVVRFRPILMTSLSTILGVVPIALSLGSAAGSRQALGVAVIGGLVSRPFSRSFCCRRSIRTCRGRSARRKWQRPWRAPPLNEPHPPSVSNVLGSHGGRGGRVFAGPGIICVASKPMPQLIASQGCSGSLAPKINVSTLSWMKPTRVG